MSVSESECSSDMELDNNKTDANDDQILQQNNSGLAQDEDEDNFILTHQHGRINVANLNMVGNLDVILAI